MIDLGTANSWSEVPEIVFNCQIQAHPRKYEKRGNCLERITCEECGYFFEVDSSD